MDEFNTPTKRIKMQRTIDCLQGLVIEIEGNIGSGKSTLTHTLKDYICSKSEDSFCSVFGEKVNNTFLKSFYDNPKRFSFAFQMYMLTTRLYQMEESYRQAREMKRLSLLDRGAVGDTLFARLAYQLGSIDQQEMEIYHSVCQERFPESISDKVDLVVFLEVDPRECHRRMSKLRCRDSESGVPLSYLEALDSTYFHLIVDWIGNQRRGSINEMNIGKPPPCLFLKWNKYGKPENVLAKIQDVVTGRRPSPTVLFQDTQPQECSIIVDTKQNLADIYQSVVLAEESKSYPDDVQDSDSSLPSSPDNSLIPDSPSSATDSPQSFPSPLSDSSPSPSVDSPFTIKPVSSNQTVAINWGLPHDNTYKRLVFHFLSESYNLIMYGSESN